MSPIHRSLSHRHRLANLFAPATITASAIAAPSGIINRQGRIAVGGVNHDGPGHFKFALVGPLPETVSTAVGKAVENGGFVTAINVTEPSNGYLTAPQCPRTRIARIHAFMRHPGSSSAAARQASPDIVSPPPHPDRTPVR